MFGIDLGTSQSAGCYLKPGSVNAAGTLMFKEVQNELVRSGEVARVENEKYFPSYVQYDDTGKPVTAGIKARLIADTFKKSTVYDAKRFIGRRYDDPAVAEIVRILRERDHYELCNDNGQPKVRIGDKAISAEEVGSEIIVQILKDAFQQERGLTVNQMVLSVPAYFDNSQKSRTKEAAVLAIKKLKATEFGGRINIDVDKARLDEISDMTLIEEPTAAFITFMAKGGARYTRPDKYVLVFDLGAGTLDITIGAAQVVKDPIGKKDKYRLEFKKTAGNTSLGGRDMDQKVIEFIQAELAGKTVDDATRRQIRDKAEEAKIKLSSQDNVVIRLMEGDIKIPLSRAKLEELIGDILKKCRGEIRTTMKDAGIKKGDISAVVMVGGPTFMPSVRKLVEEEVGIPITTVEGWDPMTCVSEGAARSLDVVKIVVIPRDYYLAIEFPGGFSKAACIAAMGETANLDKEIYLDAPTFNPTKLNDILFKIVEVERKDGVVVKSNCVWEYTLPVAPEPRAADAATRQIDYHMTVEGFDNALIPYKFNFQKLRVKCRITGEGIIVKPKFTNMGTNNNIEFPNIKNQEQNMGSYAITDNAQYESRFGQFAKDYAYNNFDVPLENMIKGIMTQVGCGRQQAIYYFIKWLKDDPDVPPMPDFTLPEGNAWGIIKNKP